MFEEAILVELLLEFELLLANRVYIEFEFVLILIEFVLMAAELF